MESAITKKRLAVCRYFNSVKGCDKGDQCRFIHEIMSVRKKPTKSAPPDRDISADQSVATFMGQRLRKGVTKPGLCWAFQTPQGCHRKERCRFRHEANINPNANDMSDSNLERRDQKGTDPNAVERTNDGFQSTPGFSATDGLRITDSLQMPGGANGAAPFRIGINHLRSLFQLFSDLPAELRLKIWRIALRQGHKAVLRLTHWRDKSDRHFVRRCHQPVLLSVCHEARVEALKHYTLSFGTATSPPLTYFNFERDLVVFNSLQYGEFGTFVDIMTPHELGRVWNLMIKLRDWSNSGAVEFRDCIWKFKNLKRLGLMISDREEDEVYSMNRSTVSVVKEDMARELAEKNPRWVIPKVKIRIVPGLKDYYDIWTEPPRPVVAPPLEVIAPRLRKPRRNKNAKNGGRRAEHKGEIRTENEKREDKDKGKAE